MRERSGIGFTRSRDAEPQLPFLGSPTVLRPASRFARVVCRKNELEETTMSITVARLRASCSACHTPGGASTS